ncbi:unnamed protein product [Acanthocheilonema viteae]|uniref:Uncharacterized protein n=1 Tax=Acanthocheilonema viteae TaxID=6277 RepID=A0A498SMD7_ACAVI|nr:unnamed protein product [Acanthocheilonema viteae]
MKTREVVEKGRVKREWPLVWNVSIVRVRWIGGAGSSDSIGGAGSSDSTAEAASPRQQWYGAVRCGAAWQCGAAVRRCGRCGKEESILDDIPLPL